MEKKMNLNELARKVAKLETGKVQVSIAQIKEIIKIISIEMSESEEFKSGKLTMTLLKSGHRHRKVRFKEFLKNGKKK